jgi:hypothetical protein
MFLSIDGGGSRIFSSDTSQGARRRHFLALMVGTPGSLAPAPPRGAVMLSDLQLQHLPGGRCQCFLALMVGTPGSPAPTPPKGPADYLFNCQKKEKMCGEKRYVGPTCRFTASLEEGLGATVGTL